MSLNRILLLVLALAAPALAHEIKRDGDVGALLHIEPDDDPAAGKPTVAWFEATRRGGTRLGAAECDCTVSLYRGAPEPSDKPLLSLPAKDGTAGGAKGKLSAAITFPEVGAYTLVLEGKPRAGAAFAPFRLEWVVRASAQGGDHDGHG